MKEFDGKTIMKLKTKMIAKDDTVSKFPGYMPSKEEEEAPEKGPNYELLSYAVSDNASDLEYTARSGPQVNGGNGGNNGCSYKGFMACNPKEYNEKGVTPESSRIKRYIVGLAPKIQGMLRATQPTTIQSAILRAGILTDEAVSCGTLTKGNEKRKGVEETSKSEGLWKEIKKAKWGQGLWRQLLLETSLWAPIPTKVNAASVYGYYCLKAMFVEKLQLIINVDWRLPYIDKDQVNVNIDVD
nr:reverse transcriptase domain-containing protein [Tanacetum cinerariifolium]